MLITNFASGELSETLFGRTDLPPYYQGASRLENFEVIPTGGIRRRNGTRRVRALEREGRLIPFIADREESFLVVLSPGHIEILKEGEPVFAASDTVYTPDEEVDNAHTRQIDGWRITGVSVEEPGAGYAGGDQAVYRKAKPDGQPWIALFFTVAAPRPVTGVETVSQDFFNLEPPEELWLPGSPGTGLVVMTESRREYQAESVTVGDAGSGYMNGGTVRYEGGGGWLECTVQAEAGEVKSASITGQGYFTEDIAGTPLQMDGGGGDGLTLDAATVSGWRITGVSVKEPGAGYADGEEIAWEDGGGGQAVFRVTADTGARSVSPAGAEALEIDLSGQLLPLARFSGSGEGLEIEVETEYRRNRILDDLSPAEGKTALVLEDETSGGKSQLYRYTGGVWEKKSDSMLYQTMEDIRGVQYAQKYDAMVLAHRMYPPVIIRMKQDPGGARAFDLDYVRLNTLMDNRVSAGDAAYNAGAVNDDSLAEGFLETPGNYPGCAAWFGGRLVFAGTGNDRQRVWASRVIGKGGEFNFATKTRFVTVSEELLALTGNVAPGSGVITSVDPDIMGRLAAMGDGLVIKPGIFPDGAGIVELNLEENSITVSGGTAGNNVPITDAELEALRKYVTDAEAALNAVHVAVLPPVLFGASYTERILYYTAYAGHVLKKISSPQPFGGINVDAYIMGPAYSDDTAALINALAVWAEGNGSFALWLTVTNYINALKNIWHRYVFRGETFLGKPSEVYSQIVKRYPARDGNYFVVSKRLVVEDCYPVASDGFSFEIASDMSDAICWLGQNKNLLIGTETAEWVVPAGVSAVNTQAVLNSRHGSDRIQGAALGDAFCFFQAGRKALVEYYIPQQDTNFRANNMAMLSPGMLHESPATGFDFASAPYTRLFVPREDGTAVCLLYERGAGVFAWGRIITAGAFKSVAVLPGQSGYDEAFFIVERDGAFFLERLDERGRVYLDGSEPWTGPAEQREAFGAGAVVYDETDGKVYPLNGAVIPPAPGDFSPAHVMHVGYPFTSRVKSMPILANDRMKQNNIKALSARFRDSFMPRVRSEPNGVENSIPHRGKPGEGFSGVAAIPFPGVYDRDVFFEFVFQDPRRCEILAVNAEVN
jgi:hypothetical protein